LPRVIFPYDSPRPGQEDLSAAIIGAALRRGAIAIEAPNGFGKTAAALAALILLVNEQGFSCVYAVRTKREMDRVMTELSGFAEVTPIRAAPLLSLADGCLLRKMERLPLPPEVLPNYCKGSVLSGRCFYYDALPRVGRFAPAMASGVEDFVRHCESLRVCPYYLGKLRAVDSDITVTTYPHLLNEALRRQLLGMGKAWKKELVVFDEAHNLPEMLYWSTGSSLTLKEVEELEAISAMGGRTTEHSFCAKLKLWLDSLGLNKDDQKVLAADAAIRSSRLQSEMETLLMSQDRRSAMMFAAEPLDAGFLLRLRLVDFASSLARAIGRDDSRIIVKSHGAGVSLAVRFLDVKAEFSMLMEGLWSPVFLSATFFDFQGFSSSLGLEDCAFMEIGRDPLERRCLTIIDPAVTTEYRKRGKEQFLMIATRLATIGRTVGGSMACFFPSYEVLEAVAAELLPISSMTFVKEARSMPSEDQAEAVRTVASSSKVMLLGVMGGRFSEGEDFSSGSLSAVAVVGLPLPPPSVELSARMAFARSGRGPWIYDSLVIVPAVAKVVQSAGRLFRRKGQTGLVVLMDRRFNRRRILEMLPAWMKERVVQADTADDRTLGALLAEFA
jgi:DNA excision repair protein ERCC-2